MSVVPGSIADFRARLSADPEAVARAARESAHGLGQELGIYWAVNETLPDAPAGPLAGLPFCVKDNVKVAGLPTTSGTPALRGAIPPRDAELVARLKAAGADFVGKVDGVAFLDNAKVKAAVTGSGRAAKDQVGFMVAKILGLSEVPKPADAADSLAIAICHAWRSPAASDSVNLTKAQKAWLAAERAAKRN